MKLLVIAFFVTLSVIVSIECKKDDDDFRNEFDKLLFQQIMESLRHGEEQLLRLQEEIDLYDNAKEDEHKDVLKKQLLTKLKSGIAMTQEVQTYIKHELKRTDLNLFERFNYEVAEKSAQILELELKKAERHVNNEK